MTFQVSPYDCGLIIIGKFPPFVSTETAIDNDILIITNNNKENYTYTQIMGTFRKTAQKRIWTYLVEKHGFKQTPWIESKYQYNDTPYENREKIAIFYKPLSNPNN